MNSIANGAGNTTEPRRHESGGIGLVRMRVQCSRSNSETNWRSSVSEGKDGHSDD